MPYMKFSGVNEFGMAVDGLVARASKASQRGANAAADLVERRTKDKLKAKTHRRGTKTPSRPGEPPALISGTGRRSVTTIKAVPVSATSWMSKVGPTVIYMRIQELGGQTGRGHRTRLPARPYLAPAVQELIDSGAMWAAFRSGWDKF